MTLPRILEDDGLALVPGTLTIGVLMGGASREREVSLASGRAVAEALGGLGHDVRPADVRPGALPGDLLGAADVAFLALHGPWGEDGGLQAELDALGVCYTGSGPEASRLAMDKVQAKSRFVAAGVPTPAFRMASRGDHAALAEAFERLGPHLVAKPVADGSSLGVSLVATLADLRCAAEAVWAGGESVLVERRVFGREVTVGILGEQALPILEIRVPGGKFYDYHYKYESDETQYVFEHGLPEAREARIRAVAHEAHRALGCRDLSRVDLMVPDAGEPQVLEINTIPGFTSHSLVPKAAARAGLSFGRLCERLAALALRRRRRNS